MIQFLRRMPATTRMAVGILAFIAYNAFAGTIELRPGAENQLRLTENTWHTLRFTHSTGSIRTLDITAEGQAYTRLLMAGYSRTDQAGSPEMPVRRELVEVPLGAEVRIEIIKARYRDLDLAALGYPNPVFPAQPPASKELDDHPFIINPSAYALDAFAPESIVSFEILGTLRSYRIGRLDIFPVHYNPVTHTLRVFEEIEAVVHFDHPDLQATFDLKDQFENHYFRSIGRSLINYMPQAGRDTITAYPISYLIVSDPMFQAQLQPFIQWKTKQGYSVTVGYTNDPQVGTTTATIKSFIQNKYNNPGPGAQPPSFVLLVGDIQQIPAWNGTAGSHVTDLYYFEYTNDKFPEMYYGRFSAQNPAQLQPQIDKTLQYEQYTMPDPTYLNEVVMVAGMDASFGSDWANGQVNYGTINYFNASNGIISHTYLYPESGSHAADIIQDISNGVTYGNYTAHCSPSGWGDPSFTTGDIPSLQNQDQYGLLVGNCCLSSKYDENECFAEALLRAENKGAVAYIGASNNTYWDEDYYWGVGVGQISGNPPPYEETTLGMYDRAFHTHGEPWADWYTTADQHVYAGNMAVTLGVPGSMTYYWETYCVMGDPSLMVYFSEPPAMSVEYLPLMPLSSASFTVEAEPYAYVGISVNGVLKGAALADATGVAEVPLVPITAPGTADIVVTGQNRQPHFGTVIVANPEGPYILLSDYQAHELTGYVNNKLECGEVVTIDLDLRNYGLSDGIGVEAILSSSDPYITITDSRETCGTVPAQSIVTVENAFSIVVSELIPNNHEVEFTVSLEDASRETWMSEMTLVLAAPVMNLVSLTVNDTEGGNGNGRLDPGESAGIIAVFSNQGQSIARNTLARLYAHSGFIDILNPEHYIGNLGFFGNTTVTFNVEVDAKAPAGILAEFIVTLEAGAFVMNEIRPLRIGLITENFETGNFSSFNWAQAGNSPWTIINQYPYQGLYSAQSGVISHGQSSELSLAYHVMQGDSISFYRKVSSESGDKLKFLIDGVVAGEWSGTTGGWKYTSFYVPQGNHTFKWIYVKDGSGTAGADAAWIDNIVFPPSSATTLYAGEDASQCTGSAFQCLGMASQYQSIDWATSGTGTFDDAGSLIPMYTPSADDYAAGTVTLTLHVLSNGGEAFSDEMILSFLEIPASPELPSGPDQVLIDTTYISEYTTTAIENASSYQWMVIPDYAGYFTGSGTSGTIVWNRDFAGTAQIGVLSLNQCGSGFTSPWLEVTVENSAVGITEPVSSSIGVRVYPNPASDVLNVEISGELKGEVKVMIMNSLGIEALPCKGYNPARVPLSISVGHLSPGIYLLNLTSDKESITRKIIIR